MFNFSIFWEKTKLHTGLEPAVFRLGGECLTIWPMEPSFSRFTKAILTIIDWSNWEKY